VTWPWPADNATERARRIANSLLALLPPEERERHIATAHRLGETWLGSSLVTYTLEQAITTHQAATLLAVSEDVIRRWACLAHPRLPERPLLPRFRRQGREMTYLVKDLLDAAHEVRISRRRAGEQAP